MNPQWDYREPDAHYPPNSGIMECNKCHGRVWTGDDMWACDCDAAIFPYVLEEVE